MTPEEFNKLLNRINKDKNAVERLYDFYYPRIRLHIKRKYKDISAEDVAQEFFVNLLSIKSFNHIKNPTSWVYTACDNIAKKYFYKVVTVDLDTVQIEDDMISIIDLISNNQEVKIIFEILDDEISQKVFYLYYWEGYNLREISELLKLNKSTIKQKHTRGIKKIKNMFKKEVAKNQK